MKKIIESVLLNWIARSGRYETFVVTNEIDRQACINVLEEVRRKELNRVSGHSVLSSKAFQTKSLCNELIACRDTKSGEFIGCMRITKASDIETTLASRIEYQLHLFEYDQLERLSIFTRLAIIKSHRKSPAALLIMIKGFLHVLSNGGNGVLMSCEPNLFRMYKKLGLLPLGGIHNSCSGGYRIPMICIADRQHFKAIGCPALPLLRSIDWERYNNIVTWYKNLTSKNEAEIESNFGDYSILSKDFQCPVTRGISKKGRQSFVKNAMAINCKKEDLIIAKHDGGKFFGSITSGFARIEINGKTIGFLRKGEIFGELSFILNEYRPFNIIAGDKNTQILLYSVSALNRMKSEADKAIVWQNFAISVAHKLINSNGLLKDSDPVFLNNEAYRKDQGIETDIWSFQNSRQIFNSQSIV